MLVVGALGAGTTGGGDVLRNPVLSVAAWYVGPVISSSSSSSSSSALTYPFMSGAFISTGILGLMRPSTSIASAWLRARNGMMLEPAPRPFTTGRGFSTLASMAFLSAVKMIVRSISARADGASSPVGTTVRITGRSSDAARFRSGNEGPCFA